MDTATDSREFFSQRQHSFSGIRTPAKRSEAALILASALVAIAEPETPMAVQPSPSASNPD